MADSTHSFSAYFKRAVSPIVTLAVLGEKPMYGYEISTVIRERSGGQYTISVMYPILYRLEEQGYIRIHHTEVVDGRVRNYYEITEAGRAYLDVTLREFEENLISFRKLTGGIRE